MTARRRVVHSVKRPSSLPISLIFIISAILITVLIIAYLLIAHGHEWLLLFERAPSISTQVFTPLHLFFLLNLLIVSIILMTQSRGEAASAPRPVHTAAPSSTTSGQCLTTVSPLGHELDQRSGMGDHAEGLGPDASTMWMSRSMLASPDSRERPRYSEEEEHNCAEVSLPTTGSDYEQYINPEHQSSRKVIVKSFTNETVDYTDNVQIDEQGCTKAGTDDTQRNAAEVMAKKSKQVAQFGEGQVQQKISGSNQERPLASTHFTHKKAHASKSPLKVSKPSTRKGDTLDATWKAICDDKSKQSNPFHHHRATLQKKGDCHTIRDKFDKESHMLCLSPSKQRRHSGISKRRELSIPRDELNARVESFISNFNQQIRIQREQSLLSYKKMVDRGA